MPRVRCRNTSSFTRRACVPAGLATRSGGGGDAGAATTTTTPTTVAPCLPGHADYDGIAANGCEAAPDDLDGTPLETTLEPNLVPADDVDEFPVVVDDGAQLLCDGELRLTVTAPAGVALRLTVEDEDGEVLGEVTSADGVPATVRLREPSCGGNDSQTLTARVSGIGSDRSAEPYLLERAGGW